MKKVPELRFDGFQREWDMGTLSDLGSVSMNRRIYKEETSEIGDVPFYKIGTFGARADSYISRDLFEEYKSKYPYPKIGDLLISASGSIGKVIEYKGEDAYYQDSNIVWLDVNEKVKNSFLKQFYETVNWNELEGSTIKRLYNKDLLRKKISYPKLSEQEKIGDLFKKIDDLIEVQEGKVSKMEDFKKSMLQKMFPKKDKLIPEFRFDGFNEEYKEVYLTDIGKNIKGMSYSKKDVDNEKGGSEFIHYGMMFTDYASLITDSIYKVVDKPNSVKSKVGDLIMPASSTTSDNDIVSASAVAKDGIIYGGDINIIRTNDIDLAVYLSYYITGTELKNLIFKNVEGTTIHHLYFKSLKNITVKLPPMEEQKMINKLFINIDKRILKEEKLLDSYKLMKKSLLQKMFV